jgi:hypothetical protein
MFRQLALFAFGGNAAALFDAHPIDLVRLLEATWEARRQSPNPFPPPPPQPPPLGHPLHRSDVNSLPAAILGTPPGAAAAARPPVPLWDHLIYAYMIENTRIYEIFRRVLYELLHGEKIGTPTPESQKWLRTTEDLFYRDSAPFTITSVASYIRPDLRANRRNAYQRMFGMDLNHGSDDGKPYQYVKADVANGDFVATFEELLREVWVGMSFVTATSSSNPTDDSKIATLAQKLHDMLRSRRNNGNLAREEFAAVAMMSWFHLTLEANAPIVAALRADGTGIEQSLFKIAERVGLPAHGLSKNFFDIADPMSRILIQIEQGDYNDDAAAPALYSRVTVPPLSPEGDMRTIITHWTAITGHDVKARKVAAS